MSEFLSADQILEVEDIEYSVVEVPEWGGKVRVRGLNSKEWGECEDAMIEHAGTPKQRVRLAGARERAVQFGAVDADGKRLFRTAEQVEKLGRKSAAALSRVAAEIQRLTKASEKDYKEIVGNSEGGDSDDS